MKRKNPFVLIAGGSGLIGKAISEYLVDMGHKVYILSRAPTDIEQHRYHWNPDTGFYNTEAFKNTDIIINLAGAGITDKFWTRRQKEKIVNSRINSVKTIFKAINETGIQPKKIIQASAIGYYGHRPNEIITEYSTFGTGFLSEVCQKWENTANELNNNNFPLSILRFGVVLSKYGGYLEQMLRVLRNRINPVFGSGNQEISWIHINDLVKIIGFLTRNEMFPNVINAVSPHSITALKLQKAIVKNLNQRTISFKINTKILKIILGEFSEVFLSHQHVTSNWLEKEYFTFDFPDIESALNNLLQ